MDFNTSLSQNESTLILIVMLPFTLRLEVTGDEYKLYFKVYSVSFVNSLKSIVTLPIPDVNIQL